MNDFVCPFLTVNSPDTEILTQLVSIPYRKSSQETVIAPGTTLYRNAAGGKVAVYTAHLQMPWYNYLSPGRKRLLIKVLDKLNGTPLPYIVMEGQNIYALHAILPDQTDLLAIINLNFDALSSIHIRVQKAIRGVQYLSGRGTWEALEWKQKGNSLEIFQGLADYEPIILKIER